MSFIKEFKEFALKGNVMDLAVGVIIGGAFKTIVDAVVGDLIMPVVGIFFKADFSNLYFGLNEKVRAAAAANPDLSLADARKLGPVFAWGDFVSVVLNFIILALIIFLMIKGINSLKRKQEEAPVVAEMSSTDKLLTEIRDSLKQKP
jgi:large conductance mechanosensitive channel